jgi:NAD binding domain of 6-phosphogluconate dehydrogenase
MNIAFLGLGRMGRVLASHVNAEHDLTVWNRSPAAASDLVAAGARAAATPDEEVLAALDKSMLSAAKDLKLPVFRGGTYGDTQLSAALLAKDSRLIVHTSRDPLPAATAAFTSLHAAVAGGHGDDDLAVIAAPELP